jgi:hypothetical protein
VDATQAIDSWWVTGLFVAAVVLNLLLFDRNNIGPWYSSSLAAIVIFCVVASAVHSPWMGLVGVLALVLLVSSGIVAKIAGRRRIARDTQSRGKGGGGD